MVIHLGIGELLPAVAEDDDSAVAAEHQVEFDVAMPEDVEVVVIAQLLLLFGEKHKLLFVLSFVGTWVCQLFEAAVFCPIVSKCVAPSRWHKAEEELEEGVVEYLAQEDEVLDFLLNTLGQKLQIVAGYQSVAVSQEETFSVDGDSCRLAMDLYARLLGEPTESPNVVVSDEEVDLYSLGCERLERADDWAVLLLASVAPEVLAPEIEEISEQIYGSRILRHVVEHGDDGLLMGIKI